ncbi:MAG: SDR family oxidoreductase [Candidatus Omnitrophota bacterium]|jgi:NAD(P)-dependent dehydrogenase (short-subunit alcohol dehydrogenase family)|nr:MAG: SDR family oxidoreductase [Candidatus Omnitrophota bacterium]
MTHAYFNLNNKTAFITGAASGIGQAIAGVYAQAGSKVWIADINEPGGNETAQKIRAEGGDVYFIHCDVTQPETIRAAVTHVLKESECIDVLVNNAGVGLVGDLVNTSAEDFERIMRVNIAGVFNVSKAVLPSMLERRQGVIINMASIASLIAVKDRFAYSASKGAVLMMTKSIALDYVDRGIRCNCICPARIHTPFVDEYLRKNYPGREQEIFQTLSAYQPIGRMGKPEEVAYLALYLASDEAAFQTGDAFPVSGGSLMG